MRVPACDRGLSLAGFDRRQAAGHDLSGRVLPAVVQRDSSHPAVRRRCAADRAPGDLDRKSLCRRAEAIDELRAAAHDPRHRRAAAYDLDRAATDSSPARALAANLCEAWRKRPPPVVGRNEPTRSTSREATIPSSASSATPKPPVDAAKPAPNPLKDVPSSWFPTCQVSWQVGNLPHGMLTAASCSRSDTPAAVPVARRRP